MTDSIDQEWKGLPSISKDELKTMVGMLFAIAVQTATNCDDATPDRVDKCSEWIANQAVAAGFTPREVNLSNIASAAAYLEVAAQQAPDDTERIITEIEGREAELEGDGGVS